APPRRPALFPRTRALLFSTQLAQPHEPTRPAPSAPAEECDDAIVQCDVLGQRMGARDRPTRAGGANRWRGAGPTHRPHRLGACRSPAARASAFACDPGRYGPAAPPSPARVPASARRVSCPAPARGTDARATPTPTRRRGDDRRWLCELPGRLFRDEPRG